MPDLDPLKIAEGWLKTYADAIPLYDDERRLVARALIAARQRIAELEADKGRLDWLNANVTRQSAYPKTPACIHFSIDVHRGIETHDSKPGWAGYPSLGIREIIDDAIERGSENRTYCRDCEYGD